MVRWAGEVTKEGCGMRDEGEGSGDYLEAEGLTAAVTGEWQEIELPAIWKGTVLSQSHQVCHSLDWKRRKPNK